MTRDDEIFMKRAIELALGGMEANAGGPFGCVIVRDGEIIGEGSNQVTSTNDPTAHAEVVAIRNACEAIGDFQLTGCTVYTSCEPCPMCLAAIYWSRADRMFYGASRTDAADAGFDDDFLYRELCLPLSERALPTDEMLRDDANQVFAEWNEKADKIEY